MQRFLQNRLRTLITALFAVLFILAFIPDGDVLAIPTCTTDCFVSTIGNDANSGTNALGALRNIQTAVDQVDDGGTVHVAVGIYTENVEIPSGKDVIIDGAGAGANAALHTIVDGNDAGNVFKIEGGIVAIKEMTIRNGAQSGFEPGSGVYSSFAALGLDDVIITSNTGSGIYSNLGNDLVIEGSTISDNSASNGGGLRQEVGGDLVIWNTTFSGNTATGGMGSSGFGGGIFLTRASSALIYKTTITDNNAVDGGGIYNSNTDPVTIANTTITGNTASDRGGGLNNTNDGDSDCSNCISNTLLINSTIFDNTAVSAAGVNNESIFGGLGDGFPTNPAVLTITNSIIGGSSSENCLETETGGGIATWVSNGHNISDDTSCAALLVDGDDLNNVDPLLAVLASNGGPTQTHALQAGSPALGAADEIVCAAAPVSGDDQRGEARPQGDGCDIGAFESDLVGVGECTATCYASTTGNDANSGIDFANAKRTIQNAVDTVNNGGDVIVDVGVYEENVVINKDVTITGAGSGTNPATDTIVDGGAVDSVFIIQQENVVEITDLTVTNGNADEYGGGVLNIGSTVTLNNCEILENTSGNFSGGGGVAVLIGEFDFPDPPVFGEMTITNCNIHHNEALGLGGRGGGIYDGESSTVNVLDSTIANNQSAGGGGGIHGAFGSQLNIEKSTIANNEAGVGSSSGNGGAINGIDSGIHVTNSTISGNSGVGSGGAIRNTGSVTLIHATITGNSITSDFGGAGGVDAGLVFSNLNIANSLIANSIGGPDCDPGGATITATGVNLIQDGTCSPDLDGDPLLAALASNGGPTQTHALQAGSPALSAADAAICAAAPVNNDDQRSESRPQGGGCDIGAFESELTVAGPGSIAIVKQTNPDGSLTEFEFDVSWQVPNIFLADGDGSLFPVAPAGIYTITESIPIGWRIASIDCGDADVTPIANGVSINLAADEDVVCTFNNEVLSNIIIDKVATGGGATAFSFTYDDPSADPLFNFDLTDGGGDGLFDNIAAGVYTISEVNIPAGWSLQSIVCDNANIEVNGTSVTITIGVSQTITCTFTNVQQPTTGTITLIKQTVPDGSLTEFEFDTSYQGPNILLQDGEASFVPNVSAGTYTIEEVVPIGWRLLSAVCVGADSSAIFSGISIDLEAGENVTCTFTNEKLGAIIIDKVAAGADALAFSFTYDDPSADPVFPFDLTDGDAPQIFQNIATGSYTIAEVNIPAGWSLQSIVCDGDSVNINGAAATINLGVGEEVTCTFTNTPTVETCDDYDYAAYTEQFMSGVISVDLASGLAHGTITNNGELSCPTLLGLASYRMFDNIIDNQELYDSDPMTAGDPNNPYTTIAANGGTTTFTVSIPRDCASQIDLFYGPLLPSLMGQRYGTRLFAGLQTSRAPFNLPFCQQEVEVIITPEVTPDAPAPTAEPVEPVVPELDTDLDGTPDSMDADDDNDGAADVDDAFPLDASENADTDLDGTGNNADADDDNDGLIDADDAQALIFNDTDSDLIGDGLDDSDADGIVDGFDPDIDADGDGVNNADEFAAHTNPYDNASF